MERQILSSEKMISKRNSPVTRTDASFGSRCAYCSIVNTVCFWGACPEAHWKRPLLFLCAIMLLAGITALFWFHESENATVLYVLGIPLALLAILGLLVAARGCEACVARMFGSI
jgi:Na+/melibiose symporter-like transporter